MDQFTFSLLDADGEESTNTAAYDITILSGQATQGSNPRLGRSATHAFEPYPGQTAGEASFRGQGVQPRRPDPAGLWVRDLHPHGGGGGAPLEPSSQRPTHLTLTLTLTLTHHAARLALRVHDLRGSSGDLRGRAARPQSGGRRPGRHRLRGAQPADPRPVVPVYRGCDWQLTLTLTLALT